jgi:segregation and condensation protein A
MDASETYQVRLEVFQGPLDLLLFLIKKRKIDIHDIPIAVITREYLEYLNHKERLNLDREAEFLLIAALLIYIKSQMLLPREKTLEEEKDLRQLLAERLVNYQKIKTASLLLKEKEEEELQMWRRTFLPPLVETDEMDFLEVSLFDLAESFFRLMKQRKREEARTIKGEEISLEQKMREIIEELKRNSYLDFLDYFNRQESFEEAFIAFFSLLELIKSKIIIATQESHFQPIRVWLRKKAYKSN